MNQQRRLHQSTAFRGTQAIKTALRMITYRRLKSHIMNKERRRLQDHQATFSRAKAGVREGLSQVKQFLILGFLACGFLLVLFVFGAVGLLLLPLRARKRPNSRT